MTEALFPSQADNLLEPYLVKFGTSKGEASAYRAAWRSSGSSCIALMHHHDQVCLGAAAAAKTAASAATAATAMTATTAAVALETGAYEAALAASSTVAGAASASSSIDRPLAMAGTSHVHHRLGARSATDLSTANTSSLSRTQPPSAFSVDWVDHVAQSSASLLPAAPKRRAEPDAPDAAVSAALAAEELGASKAMPRKRQRQGTLSRTSLDEVASWFAQMLCYIWFNDLPPGLSPRHRPDDSPKSASGALRSSPRSQRHRPSHGPAQGSHTRHHSASSILDGCVIASSSSTPREAPLQTSVDGLDIALDAMAPRSALELPTRHHWPPRTPTSPSGASLDELRYSPRSKFVRFVRAVLKTTQLSNAVIILALLYVFRLKTTHPRLRGQQGSEYRLAVAGLMLSNKMLDDHTFTNQTWSEITQMTLKELGQMEVEFWLGLKMKLHVTEGEYVAWLKMLERMAERRRHVVAARREKEVATQKAQWQQRQLEQQQRDLQLQREQQHRWHQQLHMQQASHQVLQQAAQMAHQAVTATRQPQHSAGYTLGMDATRTATLHSLAGLSPSQSPTHSFSATASPLHSFNFNSVRLGPALQNSAPPFTMPPSPLSVHSAGLPPGAESSDTRTLSTYSFGHAEPSPFAFQCPPSGEIPTSNGLWTRGRARQASPEALRLRSRWEQQLARRLSSEARNERRSSSRDALALASASEDDATSPSLVRLQRRRGRGHMESDLNAYRIHPQAGSQPDGNNSGQRLGRGVGSVEDGLAHFYIQTPPASIVRNAGTAQVQRFVETSREDALARQQTQTGLSIGTSCGVAPSYAGEMSTGQAPARSVFSNALTPNQLVSSFTLHPAEGHLQVPNVPLSYHTLASESGNPYGILGVTLPPPWACGGVASAQNNSPVVPIAQGLPEHQQPSYAALGDGSSAARSAALAHQMYASSSAAQPEHVASLPSMRTRQAGLGFQSLSLQHQHNHHHTQQKTELQTQHQQKYPEHQEHEHHRANQPVTSTSLQQSRFSASPLTDPTSTNAPHVGPATWPTLLRPAPSGATQEVPSRPLPPPPLPLLPPATATSNLGYHLPFVSNVEDWPLQHYF